MIFFGVAFALGVFFIIQFSSLIEQIVKGEDYVQQKLFCGVLFGILIVIILFPALPNL